ncbi:MAG: hypothetical protein JW814_03355 [Candidatus Krumholzibacteriota bacterium]|nr:hypothetical protein [Candidatus Krumholzibacteriota bacterium]
MLKTGKKSVIIAGLIIVTGIFYTATIRDGHDWGGDFSMYIHHAMNIAGGRDYNDTGYIQNPSLRLFAPETYPPVYPAMLAPFCVSGRIDLRAMKMLNIAVFLLFLAVLYLFFNRRLSFASSAVLVALIAFNRYFWEFKDNVLTEIPFLFFTYLALLLVSSRGRFSRSAGKMVPLALLTGLVCYLAYGTRSIGIVLIPSLLILNLVNGRKITVSSVISIVFFFTLMVFQAHIFHSDSSYFRQMSFDLAALTANAARYARSFGELWVNGYSDLSASIISLVFLLAAVAGFIMNLFFTEAGRDMEGRPRHDRWTIEIFLFLYLCPILIFPGYGGSRYMMPLIPIYIFYALSAFRVLLRITGRERTGVMLIATVLLITYSGAFSKADFGPIEEGPYCRASVELFDFIRGETDTGDIFIIGKPRVLSLYTGRTATVYHDMESIEELLALASEVKAGYLIKGPFERDSDILLPIINSGGQNLKRVYINEDFEVFRIIDR